MLTNYAFIKASLEAVRVVTKASAAKSLKLNLGGN